MNALTLRNAAALPALDPAQAITVYRGKDKAPKAMSMARFVRMGTKDERNAASVAQYAKELAAGAAGNFLRDCIEVLCTKKDKEKLLHRVGQRNPSRAVTFVTVSDMVFDVSPKLAEGKLKGEKLLMAGLLVEYYKQLCESEQAEPVATDAARTIEA